MIWSRIRNQKQKKHKLKMLSMLELKLSRIRFDFWLVVCLPTQLLHSDVGKVAREGAQCNQFDYFVNEFNFKITKNIDRVTYAHTKKKTKINNYNINYCILYLFCIIFIYWKS